MSKKTPNVEKNILVTWASPESANIGVQTLANGAEFLANRVYGDKSLLKFTFSLFNEKEENLLLSNKQLLFSQFTKKSKLHNYLSRFDLILDTCGGDSFTDIYGTSRFFRILLLQRAAAQIGVPLVMTHQTFGPIRNKVIAKLASMHLIRNSNILLICRDSESHAIAKKFMPDNRLILASDLSFYFQEEPEMVRSGVAVNVSGLLWDPNSHVDYMQYRSESVRFIELLLESGYKVTIFENVSSFQDSADDDSRPSKYLKARFGDSISYSQPKSIAEAKNSLKSFEVVVGARMHACLNSLTVGTPAIALAYSRKFAPIFGDLGWPMGVDLRNSDFFAEDLMVLIPKFALKTGDVARVKESALNSLHSTEPKVREWLAGLERRTQ
jgi:polysaccharide pyruvyl transferase WcaK-like protein